MFSHPGNARIHAVTDIDFQLTAFGQMQYKRLFAFRRGKSVISGAGEAVYCVGNSSVKFSDSRFRIAVLSFVVNIEAEFTADIKYIFERVL